MPLPRPLLPLWAAVLAATAGGLVLTLAFPALSWWPVVFVAVPLALVSLVGRRVGSAILVGFVFGAALFFVNLSFTARYLGPLPWIALATLESLLTAAMAVPITLAYRWLPRVAPGTWGRLIALPALVAGLWVSREELLGTFPYGGFPWARLGVTQASSPLAETASWTGMSGLSFLIVFACAAGIEYLRLRHWRDARTAIPAVAAVLLMVLLPQFPTTDAGTIRVGAVQGNGPAGYFDEHEPYDVLRAQLDATAPIEDENLDVLLWPEGGVDADPTQNESVARVLDGLAERVDAPLLVSAVTQRGDEYFNSSLVWEAGADNPTQTYDKRHPVPFGEYIPDRAFWRPFAPDLIDLVQREYTPGSTDAVMDLGRVVAGISICFDIVDDQLVRDTVDQGAGVVFAQTNNADFIGTDENLQQLAIARIRAIETGRAVVNISTVGTSGVILPDGTVTHQGPIDTPYTIVMDVPVRTGTTPAVLLGRQVEQLVCGVGLTVLVAAFAATRGGRAARNPGATKRRRG